MMRAPDLVVVVSMTTLLGCASASPVQPVASSKSEFESAVYGGETVQLEKPTPNAEVFRAFYQGGSSFVSVASVRNAVEQMATKHCARQSRAIRPIQETASKPPHILGNFPRVEWLFECVAQPESAPALAADRVGQLDK